MTKIPDQIKVWDGKHSAGDHESLRYAVSPLAKLAEPTFPKRAHILELGCGVGRDAIFFEGHGHTIVATDGSRVVIEQNVQHFPDTKVDFSVLDMTKPLPYKPGRFDVVYANLSLHYYSHETTPKIINEIARALKPGGLLAFACKSVDDLNHGNGEEVEENIFVSKKGHVRHLFTIPYANELLEGIFDIEYIDQVEEEYNGEKSNIIRCIARKPLSHENI